MNDDTDDSTSGDDLHAAGLRRGDDGHDDPAGLPDAGPGFAGRSRGDGGPRTAAGGHHAGPSEAGRPVGPSDDAPVHGVDPAREPGEPPAGRFVAYTGWVDINSGLGHIERVFIEFGVERPSIDRPFRPSVVDYGIDWSYDIEPGDHAAAFHYDPEYDDRTSDDNDRTSDDNDRTSDDNHDGGAGHDDNRLDAGDRHELGGNDPR